MNEHSMPGLALLSNGCGFCTRKSLNMHVPHAMQRSIVQLKLTKLAQGILENPPLLAAALSALGLAAAGATGVKAPVSESIHLYFHHLLAEI